MFRLKCPKQRTDNKVQVTIAGFRQSDNTSAVSFLRQFVQAIKQVSIVFGQGFNQHRLVPYRLITAQAKVHL